MKYLAALAVVCGCMSPVIPFGSGKSAHEAQHDRLAGLLPPQLDMERRWPGAPRTAKIRVWADDDFRAQNLRWEQTFGEALDYANAVLEPVLGLHLFAEYRDWSYRAVPGSALADELAALQQMDPGDDVLSVIGLTSSLTLVSASFEQLGLGNMPGRHVVLRGYADLEERRGFDRGFPALSADERAAALEARRRHKTTAVLLHELAHNLGADHDPEADTIMNAKYSDHAAAFTDRARQAALATLDQRLHPHPIAPPPTLPAPHEAHGTLVMRVSAAGAVEIDGTLLDAAAVDNRLRAIAERDPETELTVEVARKTPPAVIVQLVDRAKAFGLRRVAMAIAP
jgi:hypothetical protein